MEEEKEETNNDSKKKEEGKYSLVIVVVTALLLIGGVLVLNKFSTKDETESNDLTSEETNSEDEESTNEEESSVEEETMENEENNVVEENLSSILKDESLVTLDAALVSTKLDEALSQVGPFTLLAPSEEAFKKLPEGAFEEILNDPEKLADLLKAHVIGKKITSEEIMNGEEESTLQGSKVLFTKDDEGNVKAGNANVTKADISTGKGIIHVIDAVLLPE